MTADISIQQQQAIALAKARKRKALQSQEPAPVEGQGNDAGARNAFAYGITGGAIPFGNRITSALGATIANAADGLGVIPDTSWKDLYEQSLADTKATQEANPGATLAGNVLGIAGTLPLASSKALLGKKAATTGVRGAVNAIPQGLSKVGNFARSGNLASRAVKGAAVAAPVGALYGAGEADSGEMLQGALRGGGMAAGVGAALPVGGAVLGTAISGTKSIGKGIMARGEDALDAASEKIGQTASRAYSKMREIGADFTPQASQKIVSKLEQSLAEDGPLNPRLHDKVSAAIDDIRENGFSSLEQLDQWRQVLGDIAGNFSDKVNARKAKLLINAIDDSIDSISAEDLTNGSQEAVDALLTGRKEWSRRARFETVSEIVKGASGDANKLKRDLEKLRLNKKKTRGWSDAERDALKRAATQTTGEGILKALGKFGFDLGSGRAVGNTALPVIGGLGAGLSTASLGPAAAVPAAGTVARLGQKALASGKAEDLLKIIEQGGDVSIKELGKLPPKEASKVLSYIKTMAAPKSASISEQIKRNKK